MKNFIALFLLSTNLYAMDDNFWGTSPSDYSDLQNPANALSNVVGGIDPYDINSVYSIQTLVYKNTTGRAFDQLLSPHTSSKSSNSSTFSNDSTSQYPEYYPKLPTNETIYCQQSQVHTRHSNQCCVIL
jgi:hypothetical protein